MPLSIALDKLHYRARQNKWLVYFANFCRISLALGFIPSGMTKIMGERFTALAIEHPMGHYLEALHYTGYYYTMIGVMQVLAAMLLLIPRTALLGAIIYFPIILNICILSFAVRFEGSIVSSPLMVMACLYLLCWDYHKLKWIFPWNQVLAQAVLPPKEEMTFQFPFKFFTGVAAAVAMVFFIVLVPYKIMPRNTLSECQKQCPDNSNPEACQAFCECIHVDGKTLKICLEQYTLGAKAPR